MNFSTPWRVLQTIRAGDDAAWTASENRLKINNAVNCVPPLDATVAKKMGVKVNVSWGELAVTISNAVRQMRRAYYGPQYFFNIGMPYAPPQYQQDWQLLVTDQINRKMRDSIKYFEVFENMASAVMCHGIGPRGWFDPYKWCPDFISIEDMRIPTDTTLDFEYMEWYAIRKSYAPGELAAKAFAKNSRWNKKVVMRMLKNKKNQNWDFAANSYDWETQPEKFAELLKQDGGYYMGDAQPTFPFWHFYFKDDTIPGKEGWWLKIVPAEGAQDTKPDEFLWESKEPVARKREHLMQCQFGDLSGKAPHMVKAVRSLGFVLLEPTFYSNLTLCRLMQHVHDNFNVWLRSSDPIDKARASVQEFGNNKIVAPGLSIIGQAERHQIEGDLVQAVMAHTKQLQQEASTSYTSSTDTGTKREQTAFETSVKADQVNSMLGGILIKSFMYAKQEYIEICRRFTIPNSKDPDVQEVQQACKRYGIDRRFMDSKSWVIEPVTPLGMGNPTLARSAAKELMEILPQLDPTAQQEAKHEIVLTITNDPRKAARWVPLGKNRGITDAQRDAQAMFGTLMQGVRVPPREGLSPIDQVDSMLPLMAGKIDMLTKRDNMATRDEAMGLMTVEWYINTLVQQVAQDKNEKQRVKMWSDDLKRLDNELKGLSQRGAEKAQKSNGNGMSPEMAKIQATMMQAKAKTQITQGKAAQKAKLDADRFVRDQRREDAKTFAQIQRDNSLAKAKRESMPKKAPNAGRME